MVSSYMFVRGEKMNNKMFLNNEAGFLVHTKRKRRFAVTLVGVFFMLLACAGAIGFGQVAYAADEKTVPNFKSPDPDYPWYGYDAYTGAFLRYHDLRVNLNGSRSYQVYCFNIKKNYPRPFTSSDKKWYKRLEGTAETFKVHAMAPRVGGEELTKKLRSVMYNGYPNDGNNIMKGLEPSNAIEVTQYAVWYYSDKSQYEIETLWKSEAKEGKISESQVTLMREALRKLISSDEDLVKQVPSNFKLSTFESSDKSYQNLLSAEFVPDDPPKPGDTSEHNPKTPELDGSPIPEDPKHPDDNLEPTLPPVMLDGEEVPEVPSESLEPALPPLMPELDGEEVPEKPSIDLPIEVPRYEFNNKDQSPLAGESGETEYITEVYGNQQNPVDIDKKLPNETGFSGNMVETEDTKEPGVLMGGQSESVEFTKDTQTGMRGQTTPQVETEDTKEPGALMGGQSESVEFTKDTQTGMRGQTAPQVETEDTKEPGVLMGGQSESVEFTKDTQTGMRGQTAPQVETEDTKEPGVLMGGQSESVEFTKDTQTGMSGFSETVTIVEDTRPKLVFHFDNNEPKVEENREKPTKNITPILPATGDIENVLAFLGILILSVLSIFSLLKNKQNNKV
ncbi:TPA: fibronectin-binding protein PrtF1/SfbI [Streptococcus pyogenes]|uniref:fibronectin-binding protein PrtF1/SfbI n=3 Tax=Streptococcus pyogenes TaxID=1314 RepID=UPI0010A10A55|nr:fibronectin-binding protein PrtF1/SfbI [Streptococcus pyogenes]HES1797033.1 fibronectin-binding protein SfbI [Streptococcus pyogenes]HES1798923.1 fibronectin-binding protein SfbI [Streptococcus pyogenes]HES1812697.1 fibronectin-binding protein SfbI [Streptococcus pyogenes]HES1898951.1 fibronectin-binding protein SfbI [Streptococcus pyogenes]HES2313715.1 fibronectin-binding protein SfbI [Streptococcus pyogenes]